MFIGIQLFFSFELFVYQLLDDLIIIQLDTFVKEKYLFLYFFLLLRKSGVLNVIGRAC